MNEINIIMKNMKDLYAKLNTIDKSNINIEEIKNFQCFVKGYSCDLQELIYNIKNK